MTTPEISTTVNVQDVRVSQLGPHAAEAGAHASVPGLGNVTAASVRLHSALGCRQRSASRSPGTRERRIGSSADGADLISLDLSPNYRSSKSEVHADAQKPRVPVVAPRRWRQLRVTSGKMPGWGAAGSVRHEGSRV